MSKTFECAKCGLISTEKDHLCAPAINDQACVTQPKQEQSMCNEMSSTVSYGCSSCGRLSEEPQLLCNPKEMPQY